MSPAGIMTPVYATKNAGFTCLTQHEAGGKFYCSIVSALPTIPDRVEQPILTMINRRKALTVFGLICIRTPISLLVRPCRRNRATSSSRVVRWNLSESCRREGGLAELRCRRTAIDAFGSPLGTRWT